MFPQSPKKEPVKEYPELPINRLVAQRKSSPIAKIGIIVVIAVIILGGGLFFLLRQPAKSETQATARSKTASAASAAEKVALATTTKHFNSGSLFLGFDYPSNWQVTDGTTLEAVSPVLSLPSDKGASQARIVMTIQPGQDSLPAFRTNQAVAPLASTKLTYKSPTPSQRAQTYLTAVNYDGESTVIDAFYVTGDNGYTAGQYVPAGDVTKANPLISLTFRGCNTSACNDKSSFVTIPATAWRSSGLAEPLEAMIESLQLD